MNQPKVSIIILNWNGLDDTIECLESLKKINYPNYEIVLVDNGSKRKDADILEEKYGDFIKLIRNEENYGFAEGNNIAIRWLMDNSNPDYFLLLNNDTIVDSKFLDEMIKVSEKDPMIGIVGPKTYYYDKPKQIQATWTKIHYWKGTVSFPGKNKLDSGQYNEIKDTDYVQGSCLLVKKSVVNDIGLLDSKYFAYWEETDLCIRARRKGYRLLYIPNSLVWHKGAKTTGKINGFMEYFFTRNRIIFIKKYASSRQLIVFYFWYFLIEFWYKTGILLLYHRDIKIWCVYLKGVMDGILNKCHDPNLTLPPKTVAP